MTMNDEWEFGEWVINNGVAPLCEYVQILLRGEVVEEAFDKEPRLTSHLFFELDNFTPIFAYREAEKKPKFHAVNLTQDEVDGLYAIFMSIGGPTEGPRGVCDSVCRKLNPLYETRKYVKWKEHPYPCLTSWWR